MFGRDYRQAEPKPPMPDVPYDNAIEEPTWTWDGEVHTSSLALQS